MPSLTMSPVRASRCARDSVTRPLRSALITSALLIVPGLANAGGADPDLAILSVTPPQAVHVGVVHQLYFEAWDVAGGYGDPYTVEFYLSTDDAFDPGDALTASITTAGFFGLPVFFTVPPAFTPGAYRWIARVVPVPGELEVANNVYVAGDVDVMATDLALPDASPLVFQTEFLEPAKLTADFSVANVGSPHSVLVFNASLLTPAPWLSIDIGDGFALEGEEPARIDIEVDSTGLPLGTYATTVRLRNQNAPTDFADIVVELKVGDHRIELGDRLRGQVAEAGDTDEVLFDALAGTKLLLFGNVHSGKLKLVATVFGPGGAVVEVVNFKTPKHPLKKVVALQESGEYRLVISGKGTTTGGYRIKTGRRNPKLARPREEKAVADNGGIAELPVLLYPGSSLDFSVQPNAEFAGPATLTLIDPDGASVDLGAVLALGPGPAVTAESYIADKLGQYLLRITGFGVDPDAKAKALLLPLQIPKGDAKVYLP